MKFQRLFTPMAALAMTCFATLSTANAASKQLPTELQGTWRYYHTDPDSSTIDIYANKVRVGNGECHVDYVDGPPDLTTVVDETCDDEDGSTGRRFKVKVRTLYKLRNINGLEILIVATIASSGSPRRPPGSGLQPQILEYVRARP